MDAPAVQPAIPQPPPLPPADYSMAFPVLIVSAIPVFIMVLMCCFVPRISNAYNINDHPRETAADHTNNDHHHHRRGGHHHHQLRSHDTERVRELMEGLKRAIMEASDGFVYDKSKIKGINNRNSDKGGKSSSSSNGNSTCSSDECAVCLEEFKDGDLCKAIRECQHVFHKECVVPWLMKSNTCPICRAVVPTFAFSVNVSDLPV